LLKSRLGKTDNGHEIFFLDFKDFNENFSYNKFRNQCGVISEQDLKQIIEEYGTDPPNKPNFLLINKLLEHQTFLKTLNYVSRLELLKKTKLRLYKRGEVIYNEGEIGNDIYILIKGMCRERQYEKIGQERLQIEIAAIYEGEMFGDNFFQNTNKLLTLFRDKITGQILFWDVEALEYYL